MANLNASTLSDTVKTLYEKRLLTRALSRMIHGKWGTSARLNKFGSYELRKFGSMPLVSSALGEGSTPAEQAAPSITKVTMTPAWYGAWVSYTDHLDFVNFDPVISETSSILGEQAALSFDTLLRNSLTDGATKDYAGAATQRTDIDATNDKITYADFLNALANLEAQNAMPSEGDRFAVVMHPFTFATLMQDTSFVALFQQEGGSSPMRSGKMGSILNVNIYVSSNARVYTDGGTAGADAYSCLFIGKESYGMAGFGATLPNYVQDSGGEHGNNTGKGVNPVEIIVKGLGEGGGLDPLNQRGTIGWKASHVASILNSAWIIDVEHATTLS